MPPEPEPTFLQLLPRGGLTRTAAELIEAARPDWNPSADRPYVVANFVASVDGRASLEGRSGGLGDAGDRAVFHALRENVDAILAGTATMASEGYGRMLGRPERRARRLAAGRPPEPLAVLISRSGRLPLEIPLFACTEARVAVFVPRPGPVLTDVAAQVRTHVLAANELTPGRALAILRHEHGVRSLLCEGGPALFGALVQDGLVDELFLTLAPRLLGGPASSGILAGIPERSRATEIEWLLERDASLFARLRLTRPAGDATIA